MITDDYIDAIAKKTIKLPWPWIILHELRQSLDDDTRFMWAKISQNNFLCQGDKEFLEGKAAAYVEYKAVIDKLLKAIQGGV